MKKSIVLLALCSIILGGCNSKKEKMETKEEVMITKESREAPDFSKGILTEEILWYMGRLSGVQVAPDGKTLLFGIKYYDYKLNKGNQELYTMPVAGGEPTRITQTVQDEFDAIWRPDGQKIAFLRNGDDGVQIWECDPDGKNQKQISKVENGVNGFCYAPDMKHILYLSNVQLDEKITDRYPDLEQANAMIYDDLMYRHWDAWADGTYQHIFIAAYPALDEVVELMEGEKFHAPVPPGGGISEIAWSPNGEKIAYCAKKMKGREFAESTNSDVYIYDIAAKTTINLTEANKGYDMEPVFSPDGTKLVWWSMEKEGFESDKKRLFVHDFNTGISKDYTTAFDQNVSDFVWHADGDKIYFISCIHATHQIYELNLNSAEIRQITQGEHDINTMALAGNQLIVTKTTHALPSEAFSINPENGTEQQITFVNGDILDKITMGKTEKRWIKTTDGKEMLTWVIYPPNFDANKKYPTLLYCQGGPQQAVSQFFSYR